ncbi:MAG: beta-carotene hydroxylase [Ignavibacteriae bacterium HGW-Ignavibacteriae-2]|nr:MAG: beta-carotene hydroxylase [Ignavibacteriae bacterium HGW-Ignavibacteriae-2]
MTIVINIIAFFLTYAFMEFTAWFTHKYIMHGFLWKLHKDHHIKDHDKKFEKNDYFFLMFAIPSFLLIYFGFEQGVSSVLLWIGLGIMVYGITYVLVHDIFIHRRIKLFQKTNNPYFKGMRLAHKIHHKHLTKENGECFGFIWVKKKYIKADETN